MIVVQLYHYTLHTVHQEVSGRCSHIENFFQVLLCCSQVITSNSDLVLLPWIGTCLLHCLWKKCIKMVLKMVCAGLTNIQCLRIKSCVLTYIMLHICNQAYLMIMVFETIIFQDYFVQMCVLLFSPQLLSHLCNWKS